MKINLTILFVCMMTWTNASFAEENIIGFSIGPVLKPSLFEKDFVVMTGVKTGITFNHTYYIGIGFYGITFDSYFPNLKDKLYNLEPSLEMSCLGLDLEYYFGSGNELYPSFELLGGLSLIKFEIPNYEDETTKILYQPSYKNNKMFFFIEPGANINIAFKNFYKITFGVSYRLMFINNELIPDIQRNNSDYFLSDADVNGLSLNLSIRFGQF